MERFDGVSQVNADYLERQYEQYLRDPRSLDDSWKSYFDGIESAAAAAAPRAEIPMASVPLPWTGPAGAGPAVPAAPLTMGVHNLVHSYRQFGHTIAELDPLGHNRTSHPLLDLARFNMGPADLDRQVGNGGFRGKTDGTLRDLVEKLRLTYCRTFGVEYQGIFDKTQRDWLEEHMEPILNRPAFSADESRAILFQLIAAEEFERFLHTRFVGAKRFSLEGGEALIPLLNMIVDDAASLSTEEVCMGMAHRGRLNVLAHVLNKPYEVIFSEFAGTIVQQEVEGDGDVKYHLGYANDRPAGNGGTGGKVAPSANRMIHISLSPNPSHLELIDPVVEGIVRCKQKIRGDKDHSRVVPLLIHGDAAFTGQGIVHETLGLSELPFFRTGGTIHVIVNNQIGFTTPPNENRFTPYPTDVAKMIQAPIFHVNGDDPEAVVHAARLAIAFRQQFKVDVMIDLWCYRRHGHNEVDEPAFTQPVMYREIQAHKTTRELYSDKLLKAGVVTEEQLGNMRRIARERMESASNLAKEYRPRQRTASMNTLWKGMTRSPKDFAAKTNVGHDVLTRIAESVAKLPAGFTVHPKLSKLLSGRAEAVRNGKGIDWGCGEMLALGSLLLEGTPIRFSGQDVQRGTFSHRHAVLNDYNTGKPYTPLNFLTAGTGQSAAAGNGSSSGGNGSPHAQPPGQQPAQGFLTIINSMLSELAVLGFEYGFSSADPRNLVIWEAQFGDFVNMAQPIIDQFIAAAESKWQLMNGLVMLLPHGFEGQGPEHSNAYLERFLSLCAEDNLQVCVPTTPGNYFHMLRRQIHRRFRKPLVCMMPKSLLRSQGSYSKIEEMTEGSIQLVIDDPAGPERDTVKRVLFCSGKVYYSLASVRDKQAVKDVAIVRVEQLYPFPRKEIQQILARYRQAREIAWVQEEPKNRGAWNFMEARLRELLPDPAVLNYFGREDAASPATGSIKMHEIEEQEILAHALELPFKPPAEQKVEAKDGAAAKPAAAKVAAEAKPDAVREAATKAPATASSQTPVSD